MRVLVAEDDESLAEVLVRGLREHDTLEILAGRFPGIADRRSIARHVRDNEADAFGSNAIDVRLARLRSGLTGAGVRIVTVRGAGYRIVQA